MSHKFSNNNFLFLLTFLAIISSGSAQAASVCLQNFYRGPVYEGEGVSFRVRSCDSRGNCSGWGKWDWLKPNKKRLVYFPNGGSIDVQINQDGDNDIGIARKLRPFVTRNRAKCDLADTWSFYATNKRKIWIYSGIPKFW